MGSTPAPSDHRAIRTAGAVTIGAVLASLAVTLALGLAQKAPCASGDWDHVKQYRLLCYTDVVPLYTVEDLEGPRLPYLDSCPGRCDEYPVLTMYAMRLAAWPVHAFQGFFFANAMLLAAAAAVTAAALFRLAGRRALLFALAPSLLVYAFVNWDLIAVALATVAILLFLRGRDAAAGVFIGLGAAAKLYPILFLVPFGWERLRARDARGAARLAAGAAVSWLVVNVPFIVAAPHAWGEFYRFNAQRPADFDSLWFIGCHPFGASGCASHGFVNVFSAVAFVGSVAVVWALRTRRDPTSPRWRLVFPIVVLFLLTNKVYSPQYSLWLLPLFALVLPDWRFFVAFEAADVAVFVTRFAFFGHLIGTDNGWTDAVGPGVFQAAVLVRAAVLVACLARFVLGPAPLLEAEHAVVAA